MKYGTERDLHVYYKPTLWNYCSVISLYTRGSWGPVLPRMRDSSGGVIAACFPETLNSSMGAPSRTSTTRHPGGLNCFIVYVAASVRTA